MKTEDIIYVSGGSVSILGAFAVALSFCLSPVMRKHPAVMLVYIAVCDAMFALHWLVSGIFTPPVEQGHGAYCATHAAISIFFTLGSLNWNFLLCVDVLFTVYRPFDDAKRRMIWYHLYAWLVSAAGVTEVFATGNYGIAFHTACCILKASSSEWVFAIPIFVYAIFAFISCIICWRHLRNGLPVCKKQRSVFLKRHFLCVLSFAVLWVFPGLMHIAIVTGFNEDTTLFALRSVSAFTMSIQGLVIAFIRFSEPPVRHAFLRLFNRRFGNLSIGSDLQQPLVDNASISDDTTATSLSSSVFDRSPSYKVSDASEDADSDRCSETAIQAVQIARSIELAYSILTCLSSSFADSFHGSFVDPLEYSEREFSSSCYSEIQTKRVAVSLRASQFSRLDMDEVVKHVNFSTYAPSAFKHIRALHQCPADMLAASLSPASNVETILSAISATGSMGRSGSFMFRSHDGVYMLKTVSESERDFLIDDLLPSYHKHMIQNPGSLLVKIHGCFTIEMSGLKRVHVLLMKSAFAGGVGIGEIYDLKGSYADRQVVCSPTSLVPAGTILKDGDFRDRVKHLTLDEVSKRTLHCQLQKDVTFLLSQNIMDYSLLVGISKIVPSSPSNRSCVRDSQMTTDEFDLYISDSIDESIRTSTSSRHHFKCSRDGAVHFPLPVDGCCLESSNGSVAYYIALIDILQVYNRKKALEHGIKSFRYASTSMSAVNSTHYASRFLARMAEILSIPVAANDKNII
eukprot:GILK01013002.1.p1 GENE.GILK01013002.1~~GILK01013002.1.p1  ORF type:complete len:750 (+),score=107.91 GILK01013002.1:27-2252(+)